MASANAWDIGYQTGRDAMQRRVLQKDAIKEEDRLQQAQQLLGARDSLTKKLYSIDQTQNPEDYQKTKDALNNAQQAVIEFYHPIKNPGHLEQFGHLLHLTSGPQKQVAPQRIDNAQQPGVASSTTPGMDQGPLPAFPASAPVTVTHPADKPQGSNTMVTPNPQGMAKAGNLPIWHRPTVNNADGSHSSEYSVSFNEDGKEVLVPTVVNGRFLTPDGKKPAEGSPEEQAMFKRAWDYYKKTGQNLGKFNSTQEADSYAAMLHNRGGASVTTSPQDVQVPQTGAAAPVQQPSLPAYRRATVGAAQKPGEYSPKYPSQLKAEAAARQKAAQQTEQIAAAAPVSPEQEAISTANAQNAGSLAAIKAGMKSYLELRPNATTEEQQAHLNDLIQKYQGVGKPDMKLYTLPNGTQQYFDAAHPEFIPRGATAYVKPDALSQALQDYEADPDPNKPDFTTWKARRSQNLSKLTGPQLMQDAYVAKLGLPFGTPWNTLSPRQREGYELYVNSLKQRFGEHQVAIQDRDGNVHLVEIGSATGPAMGGFSGTVPGGGAPPSGGGKAEPTPKDQPLDIQKGTPSYNKAKNDVVDATKLARVADLVAANPHDAINQKRLAVQLERTSAGRFTVQALDYVIKSGWGNSIQQWANNPTTGELPEDIVRQLVEGAHQNLDGAKAALQEEIQLSGGANTGGSGGASANVLPDAAKAQLKEGHNTTFANGQVWTLENGQPKQVK